MDALGSLAKRVTAAELGDALHTDVAIYYALHISSGHVLLPCLLALLLFSPRLKRHPTLLNVFACFIFSSISACLLLYAGRATGAQPSHELCIIQAGLINAVTPMWAVAVTLLVYNIWSRFASSSHRQLDSAGIRVAMLAAPYVSWAVWAAAGIAVAASHSDTVNRDRRAFYCSVDYAPFSTAMGAFAGSLCVVMTGFQVHLGVVLYRTVRGLPKAGGSGHGIDVAFVVRMLVFGLYVLAGLGISVAAIVDPENRVSDLFGASFGLAVFVMFGTQADVLRELCFWRPSVPVGTLSLASGRSSDVEKGSVLDGSSLKPLRLSLPTSTV